MTDVRDDPAAVGDFDVLFADESAGPSVGDMLEVADDKLAGVGDSAMSLRTAVKIGGASTISIVFLLNLADEFDRAALTVLAPDIQRTFGLSDTLLSVLGTLGGLLIVLGAIPIGYLADRHHRPRIIAAATSILAVFMLATGAVRTAIQLGVARIGTGLGKGTNPAYLSLLTDAYPTGGRARIFALYQLANPIGVLIGPAMAGAIAAIAGGDEGWRWAFVVLAVPTLAISLVAAKMRDAPRGANEMQAVFGDAASSAELASAPPRLSVTFARLRNVRTFNYILIGIGVMGFGLFSVSILFSLYLKDTYGYDALGRGYILALGAVGGLIGAPLGGMIADRLFRRDPAKAMVASSALLLGFVLIIPALYMPSIGLLIVFLALAQVGLSAASTGIMATVAAVIPYRLRSQGFALVGLYLFFVGAFFGAVIAGGLSDTYGERTALTVVLPVPMLVGAGLMAYGSRFIRRDMALVVEELEEEQEQRRLAVSGEEIPILQVRNLDYRYGQLQVLFDVNVDVRDGEVLALLGTNGAGKSTLLRAITGLGMPSRGTVRYGGRDITFTEAEHRVEAGMVHLPGGKALFPTMTVRENLLVGARTFIGDRERVQRKIDEALSVFPKLTGMLDQQAGTLSGGEQQQLAAAKCLLLDPKLLLIDELSLGLAPVVVQDLLAVIEGLKRAGVTVVIVEQSVNVALSLADRAIFMEKGRVRFEGPARELLERGDLVRAVFLGGGEEDA